MNFLIVSDTHNRYSDEDTERILEYCSNNKIVIDRIVSLGDVADFEYKILKEAFSVPFYGVIGNHDWPTVLELNNIPTLHLNLVTFNNGVTATGFSGSSNYKSGNEPTMFSQSRSIELSKNLPSANILFSHDTACRDTSLLSSSNSYSHAGLWGITEYLNHCPNCKIHIHGHLHESYHHIKHNRIEICVFRWALISINERLQVSYLYDYDMSLKK